MSYTVYVLYSEKSNLHYTGYTSNLVMRMKSHNEFGKGWTTRHRPWKIIYSKEFEDLQDAMNYEIWLKTGVGREFLKSIASKK